MAFIKMLLGIFFWEIKYLYAYLLETETVRQYHRLKLEQMDNQLTQWRSMRLSAIPPGGWVRAIRDALGMTRAQLAKRMGTTPSTVQRLESSEAAGKITLDSLKRLAEALDARVVYAVVSEKPLADIRRARARELAEKELRRVSHTMNLEQQGVSEQEAKRQLDRQTDELLAGSPRRLWD